MDTSQVWDPTWLADVAAPAGALPATKFRDESGWNVYIHDDFYDWFHDQATVAAHMTQRHLVIDCDLGLGDGTFTVLTNDLTHEYIDENTGGS